jgi:protein-S-isoprenylcysteine O-methyltransferase
MAIKVAVCLCLAWLVFSTIEVGRRLRMRAEGRVNQMAHEVGVLRLVRPLLGVAFYVGLVEWLLPGTRVAWAFIELPGELRWAGVGACVMAVGLIHWSFRALGTTYRGGVGLWPDHRLVTTGPYAWMRHPIYAGFILLTGGIWASSESWVVGASGLVLTAAIPAVRLRVEEADLLARFGAEYAAYERHTPRFVPRVW